MALLDGIALFWFLALWMGYTLFAKRKAKTTICLASELRKQRSAWMVQMLLRENRIPDVSIIATIERNVAFFASSLLLILAGLLTALLSAEKLTELLVHMVPLSQATELQIEMKILLLIFIYVFAFFQFTWSIRQYGFASVLVGSAPQKEHLTDEQKELFANRAGKVIDQAGHTFNYGLRAIYLSLASLSWFVNAWLFMLITVLVILVLYQREFHSKVLKALRDCRITCC